MDLRSIVAHKLEKAAGDLTENLVLTPKTHDDYLLIVGKVQGIRLAIELMEEAYSEYIKS